MEGSVVVTPLYPNFYGGKQKLFSTVEKKKTHFFLCGDPMTLIICDPENTLSGDLTLEKIKPL